MKWAFLFIFSAYACMHASLNVTMRILGRQISNRAVFQTIHAKSLDGHYKPVNWLIYNPYDIEANYMARIIPGNLLFST